MKLNIGSIQLPINAATKTFAILAKRGAGKTYTAGVLAEEFFKTGIPFVVFDPIDVWWGLRLAEDGKSKGLPVVVFGVNHADILLDRDMGARIAQAIVRDNISCVISTFGMPKVAQRYLIAEFCEELMRINNTPRHIFVEEAHEFVPQRVQGAMGRTFAAVESLVTMGRNVGIGVTLINQRAATLNKDVLTQIDTLIALRSVGPQDRKALTEWVEAHSADEDLNKFTESLPSLPTGIAWVWSPEFMGVFEKVKIRKRDTFHPDREKLGVNFEIPKLEQTDIQSFITKFSSEKIEKVSKKNGRKKEEVKQVEPIVVAPDVNIVAIRNEYESKLMEKDIEIRRLSGMVLAALKALGSNGENVTTIAPTSNFQSNGANEWINKLGAGRAEGKILAFLAANRDVPFTRYQIAVRTGLSTTSSGFHSAMSKLKKLNVMIKDGTQYKISPDL